MYGKVMRWCALQDYKADEDPALFHSEKTGRGPLGPNWKVRNQLLCVFFFKLLLQGWFVSKELHGNQPLKEKHLYAHSFMK